MRLASCRQRRGFSLIEVIAVLVVVGLMTAMASVTLSGVTQPQQLKDVAEMLRLLDRRVRILAEEQHRPWRLEFSQRGATASPVGSLKGEPGMLRVELSPALQLRPWVVEGPEAGGIGRSTETVGLWVHATGGSVDYGWVIEKVHPEGAGKSELAGDFNELGAFAGGTGQFAAVSAEAAISGRTDGTR